MFTRRTLVSLFLVGAFMAPASLSAQSPAPASRPEPYSYRDVVKKVLPAVVSITAKKSRNMLGGVRGSDGEESPDLRRFFDGLEQKKAPTRNELMTIGFGSGFVIDPKGIAMTNYHVIENADSVEITFEDG